MSEVTKATTGQLTPKGKLITLGIGALLGVVIFSLATNAATIAYSSLAFGDLTKSDQLTVGSRFRYDFGVYSPQPGQSFYVVTTVEGMTTAGDPVYGDPIVAAKLGSGATWYNWSIKAYWMTGVEAKSLYGKNNTGNPLWDNGIRYLFEGYSLRHTYEIADSADWSRDGSRVIARPQFVQLGSIASQSGVTFSNTTTATTGRYEVRALVAGMTLFAYQRNGVIFNYDPATGLLLHMYFSDPVTGVSAEWGVTQYNAPLRYLPVSDPSKVSPPEFEFVTGEDSSDGYIEFSKEQTFRSWTISIASSNTSVVANMPATKFANGPVPINVTNVGTCTINVTVIGDYFGVNSLPVSKAFVVTKSPPPGDKVGSTTVTSATTFADGIEVEWTAVENASEYLVYANGTFVGKTGQTSFTFNPTEIGDYSIFVIVTSTIHAESSDPSNIVDVFYNRTAAIFAGSYLSPEIPTTSDYTVFIILVIVVVAGIIVTYVLAKRGILQTVAKTVKSRAKSTGATIRSKTKPKAAGSSTTVQPRRK